MSNTYAKQLLAQYLSKYAAEEEGHEASEAPSMEMLEHAMGGQGEGEGEDSAEALLSQLSPEELEELAASLSGEMQDPSQDEGGEDVEALAQAIQQNLAQNPEASVEGAAPEQAEALDAIKSASYIEGFIKQALHTGLDIKQAVDMYDQALTETVESLTKNAASGAGRKARRAREQAQKAESAKGSSALVTTGKPEPSAAKGSSALVTTGKPKFSKRVSEATGNFKRQTGERLRRAGQYARTRPGRAAAMAGGALLAAGGGAYAALKGSKKEEDEKTAAYVEGIYKRALEYGFNETEAVQFVDNLLHKQSGEGSSALVTTGKPKFSKRVSEATGNFKRQTGERLRRAGQYARTRPGRAAAMAGGALLAAGGGAYAALKGRKKEEGKEEGKEKSAEYIEGMYKRALEHGFSPEQAEQVVYNLLS